MDELPAKYDVVVVGTGMIGSIVAAAYSRIGKAVLHIDENEYYGEDWASFNLDTLDSWVKRNCDPPKETSVDHSKFLNQSEKFIPTSRTTFCKEVKQEWLCPKGLEEVKEEGEGAVKADTCQRGIERDIEAQKWTESKLKEEHRRFNLDITPKMLYSRGPLVELLISSNIARYAEFKSVSRVLTWRENHLELVPCSRADVFATKYVTVVQKRMLVKILSLFAEYPTSKEEFEGYEDKTFVEYLKHKKLPEQLIHYIVYAIAMGSNATPCIQGVLACQKFLQSLGRYGNTPFIFPLYGAGELPQCFCRLCAVFGGVYHLNRPVDGYVVGENGNVVAIVTGDQRLEASQFVISSAVTPSEFLTPDTSHPVTRGIFITDRSIVESEKEAITLLQFPPDTSLDYPVTVFEVGSSCHVCPPGLFVVHMTTEGDSMQHVENALFEKEMAEGEKSPKVLWSLKWKSSRGSDTTSSQCPQNVRVFAGPDPGLDFDVEVEKAKTIFLELCPGEEFLPRAPDPEEIVMDIAESQEATDNSEDEKTEKTNDENKPLETADGDINKELQDKEVEGQVTSDVEDATANVEKLNMKE